MRAELLAEVLDVFEDDFLVELFDLVLNCHLGCPNHFFFKFWHFEHKYIVVGLLRFLEILILKLNVEAV